MRKIVGTDEGLEIDFTIWKDANGLLIPPFATSFATVRSSYNTQLRGAAAYSNKNPTQTPLLDLENEEQVVANIHSIQRCLSSQPYHYTGSRAEQMITVTSAFVT